MTTIFLHHHGDDVLAAEIVAGALLSLGTVVIVAYPPGPQRIVQLAPGEPIENLVVWTRDAADEPMMRALLQSLAVRRAPVTALVHIDATAPTELIDCAVWPLFDRQTAWTAYRRELRALIARRADQPQPVRWSGAAGAAQLAALRLPAVVAEPLFLPAVAVAGVLLWALMR